MNVICHHVCIPATTSTLSLSVVNDICHHVCIPDTTSTLSLSVVNVICHYEKLNQAMHLLTVLLELGKLDYLEL